MISKIPITIDSSAKPEFTYPIKLLMNMRRSVAQRFQTIRHIPTVEQKEIDALIALYRILYDVESIWRVHAQMPALGGLPKWADKKPQLYKELLNTE